MKTNLKKISRLYINMTLPVKASMWYLACSVLQKAIGFLTTPIFTRVMGYYQYIAGHTAGLELNGLPTLPIDYE